MAEAILVWLVVVLPAIAAIRFSRRFFQVPATRLTAGLAVWMLQIYFVSLLIGSLGIANKYTLIAALGFLSLPFLLIRSAQQPQDGPPPATWPSRLGLGIVTAVFILYALKLYAVGSTFFSDDYAYHGLAVAGWVQNGALEHQTINMASYYPFNPHLIAYAFCLAGHNTVWVWIASIFWVALAASAISAFGASTQRPWLFQLAAAAAIVSPTVVWMASTFAPTDLAGAAALIAAFALLRPRDGAANGEQRASLVIGMLLVGFAAGTKPTNILPAAIASVAAVWFHAGWNPRKWLQCENRLRILLVLFCGFATSGYWYVRNLLRTGNPMFPFKIGPFDGPVRGKDLDHTILWELLTDNYRAAHYWLESVAALLAWPLALGITAAIVAVVGLYTIAKHRPNNVFPWLALAMLVVIAVHPRAPFSGATLGADQLAVFNRYITFVYFAAWAIGAAGLSLVLKGNALRATPLILAPIILFHFPWDFALFTAVALFAGAVIASAEGRRLLARVPSVVAWSSAAVLLLVLLCVRPLFIPVSPLAHEFAPEWNNFDPGMRAIDDLPPGSRIAQLSNRTWENWPLYGSRFQHEAVIVGQHGELLPTLYDVWKDGRVGGAGGYPRFGVPIPWSFSDGELLLRNLRELNLDYLFVTKFSFTALEWPGSREFVRSSGEWTLQWEDGFSEIYVPAAKTP